MKKSVFIVSILCATLVGGTLLTTTQVNASPVGDAAKGMRGSCQEQTGERFLGRMSKGLELSTEQQAQVKAILENHHSKVAPLRQNLAANRDQWQQAVKAEAFDEAAVRNLAAGQAATKTELMVERARMQHQIHALLTPEQQKLAAENQAQRLEGRGDHFHGKKGK